MKTAFKWHKVKRQSKAAEAAGSCHSSSAQQHWQGRDGSGTVLGGAYHCSTGVWMLRCFTWLVFQLSNANPFGSTRKRRFNSRERMDKCCHCSLLSAGSLARLFQPCTLSMVCESTSGVGCSSPCCPGGTVLLSYLWSALGTSLLLGGRDDAQLCQGTCALWSCLSSICPPTWC